MGSANVLPFGSKTAKGYIDTMLDSKGGLGPRITKRYGHPSNYRSDGYDIGLRVRIRGNKCSYYEAISRVSGHKVTIKEHHIENYEGQEPAEEAKILSKLSHACIPRLREVFLTDNSLFMVMDFIDSKRLKNFIDSTSKTSSFAIGDVRTIVKSLLAGIHYCHERNIIIRNLTPDTIMVKKSGGIMHASTIYEVKITDFSCAVLNGSTKSLSDHPLFDWNDVPYIAPEALLEQPYSKSMDMWSVGVLIYLMIAGDLPFANSDDDKVLLNAIKHAQYSFDENPVWANVKDIIKALIGKLLISNPTQRLTAREMLKDPWILTGY
eukprot:gene3927-4291_t